MVYKRKVSVCLVGSAPGWSQGDGDIDVVSDLKLPGVESDVVVRAPPPRAGLAQILHAEASTSGVRVHGGELEHGALGTGVLVDLSDEGHEFSQSAVQPAATDHATCTATTQYDACM